MRWKEITAITDDPGLFIATTVLAGATLVLAFFTYILSRHSKELNRFEKTVDERRRIEKLLECTDTILSLDSGELAYELESRQGNIKSSLISSVDSINSNSESLSPKNKTAILRRSREFMSLYDKSRTETNMSPSRDAITKEFVALKELLAEERKELREKFVS